MDFVLFAAISLLLTAGALAVFVKAFGKEPVLDGLLLLWRGLSEVARRVGVAARVLIGVHLDKDDAMEDLAEDVEERVSYRMHGRLTALDNRIYHVTERVTKLEKQARMVLPIADDEDGDQ